VLSSYDEFSLVKQAYNQGIFDYILKTEMNPEPLRQLFMRVKTHIEQKRKENQWKDTTVELVNRNKTGLRSAFFKDLIWGKGRRGISAHEMEQLGLKLHHRNLAIGLTVIDDFHLMEQKYGEDDTQLLVYTILNIFEEVLSQFDVGDVFAKSPNEYVAIFSFPPGLGKGEIREVLGQLYGRLRHAFNQYMHMTVSSGISELSLEGYKNLFKQYKQASEALENRFFRGNNGIIYHDEMVGQPSDFKLQPTHYLMQLKQFLQNPAADELEPLLGQIMLNSQAVMPWRISEVRFLYESYAVALTEWAESQRVEEDLVETIQQYRRCLQDKGTLSAWNEALHRALQFICVKNEVGGSQLVRMTRQWISRYYMNPISLTDAAKHFNVSEGHLSRLFSNETRERFMQYLTRIRIEQAQKVLMTSNLRIYEIAEKVGYTSPEHFSRSFKEIVGQSPKEFMMGKDTQKES
jgi:YesN/AraC family two-component response regulator